MIYTNSRKIPLHSLCIIVGPANSGKTTLCNKKFPNYEILDPEKIKYELTGDNRSDLNHIVWNEIYRRINIKMAIGERVVLDSANLKKQNRINIANIALKYGVPIFYIIVDRQDKLKNAENQNMIIKQDELFKDNIMEILKGDGVAEVIDTRHEDFNVVNKFPSTNLLDEVHNRNYNGITVMGDIHGCLNSMRQSIMWALQRNHLIVFLGDIIDYGPNSLECIEEAYKLITTGNAVMVIGNHERKIEKWFEQSKQGQIKIKLSDGNKITTTAIENLNYNQREKIECKFKTIVNLSRHHWIFGNALLTHGAADNDMWNINSTRLFGKLENLALFGEIDPKIPFKDDGFPNRIYSWVDTIPKGKMVFVGHDIRATDKPLTVTGKSGGVAVFMDCGSGKGGSFFSADVLFKNNDPTIQNFVKN